MIATSGPFNYDSTSLTIPEKVLILKFLLISIFSNYVDRTHVFLASNVLVTLGFTLKTEAQIASCASEVNV